MLVCSNGCAILDSQILYGYCWKQNPFSFITFGATGRKCFLLKKITGDSPVCYKIVWLHVKKPEVVNAFSGKMDTFLQFKFHIKLCI